MNQNNFESDEIKHIVLDELEYIQFKRLLKYPEINHAYILKANDLGFSVRHDFSEVEKVKKNLKIVSDKIGFNYENIIRPFYDHTNNVELITEAFLYDGERPSLSGKRLNQIDGIITDLDETPIMSTNADCNLILIYDPIKKVFGNVHAGWRGTFGKIIKNAIQKMKKEYSCNPSDIICCLCPSIRKCHFEVDFDVANQCKEIFEYTNRINEIIQEGEIKEGKPKFYIDTVLINKILLEEEGILTGNIIDSQICSVCNSDKVHSRRAHGVNFDLATALIQKNKM